MALLESYIEYRNFPKLDSKVGILLQEESLYLLNDETSWIRLKVNRDDKLALLKALLRDFLAP